MGVIKGTSVTLINKVESGRDPFNRPVYSETETTIDNVLIAPSSSDDITDQLNLTGRKAVYTLGIPKGDTHIWEDQDVIFFGERFHVFTPVMYGIDHLIPLSWNGKVMVERYEQ